jgi:hypothetical protein
MTNYLDILPDIVIEDIIINKLQLCDILNLSMVNTYFNSLINNENIWKYKCYIEYDINIKLKKKQSWKKNYIYIYYNICKFCYKSNKLFHVFYTNLNICKECQKNNINYKLINHSQLKWKYNLNDKDIQSIEYKICKKSKVYKESDIIDVFKNKFVTLNNYYNYIKTKKLHKQQLLETKCNNEMYIIKEFVKMGYKVLEYYTDITILNKYTSGFLYQFLNLKNPKIETKNKIMNLLLQAYYINLFTDINIDNDITSKDFDNVFYYSIFNLTNIENKLNYINSINNPIFIDFYNNFNQKYKIQLNKRNDIFIVLDKYYSGFFIRNEIMNINKQLYISKIYNYILEDCNSNLDLLKLIEEDICSHFFINYTTYNLIKSYSKIFNFNTILDYKKEAYTLFIQNNDKSNKYIDIMLRCVKNLYNFT